MVDTRVYNLGSSMVYCGCGSPGVEMFLSADDLVRKGVPNAVVVDVTSTSDPCIEGETSATEPDLEGTSIVEHGAGGGKLGGGAGWVEDLPVVLVSRSHIGKRLMFASVVPAFAASNRDMDPQGQSCLLRQVRVLISLSDAA